MLADAENALLCRIGPGTAMGNVFREYWIPAVRSDELAIDSAANVCRTIFSTAKPLGAAQSNAQLALPVVADLVKAGVVNEAICAIDTLLFGCAGGVQAACR